MILLVVKTLKRNKEKMYGFRKVNPRMPEDIRNKERPESSLLSISPKREGRKSVIAFRKLFQTLEFGGRQEGRIPAQGPVEEAGQQLPGEEVAQIRKCEEMGIRTRANPLQSTANR
jgi:hypothetical protein